MPKLSDKPITFDIQMPKLYNLLGVPTLGLGSPLIFGIIFSVTLTACTIRERQVVPENAADSITVNLQEETQTSIDPQIQLRVGAALAKGVVAYDPLEAAAVVVEVETGKIRALVNWPNFEQPANLQGRNQVEREIARTAAVHFPMGSLMTPLLVARAIEIGRIKPNTIFDTHGVLRIGATEIRDAHSVEFMSVSDIVVKSSNVGGARIALLLSLEELSQTLGFDLSLQVSGLNATSQSDSVDWKNSSVPLRVVPGMNVYANLLQAVAAYMPIANGGLLKPMSVLKSSPDAVSGVRIFAPETAMDVREILVRATSADGTAPKAMVKGIRVAGKTSTISSNPIDQKSDGGERTILPSAAFVGMAPADHPRWLVGVVFRFPQNSALAYSGDTAAPVFAQIVRGLLNLGSQT